MGMGGSGHHSRNTLVMRLCPPPPPGSNRVKPHCPGTQTIAAPQDLPVGVEIHLVKQDSHCYALYNCKADLLERLARPLADRLDLQKGQLVRTPPGVETPLRKARLLPFATYPAAQGFAQVPNWVLEGAPYSSHDKVYHCPNPVHRLANIKRSPDSKRSSETSKKQCKPPCTTGPYNPTKL